MGVNRIFLLGNLGADPEVRYTPSQSAVCTLRLATGERRKNQDGEWVDHTEWHRVIAFGRTAENCEKYLSKGRQVFVEGRIQTRKWQDKEGNERYTTEVVASNVQFVGGRGDSAGISGQVQQQNTAQASAGGAPFTEPAPVDNISFEDDDIPF